MFRRRHHRLRLHDDENAGRASVEQTRNCFRTIESVLKQAGFALADVVRVVYYVLDAKDADAVFSVSGDLLRDIRPAGTILVVAGLLTPEMKIEIEVTAKRRAGSSTFCKMRTAQRLRPSLVSQVPENKFESSVAVHDRVRTAALLCNLAHQRRAVACCMTTKWNAHSPNTLAWRQFVPHVVAK